MFKTIKLRLLSMYVSLGNFTIKAKWWTRLKMFLKVITVTLQWNS